MQYTEQLLDQYLHTALWSSTYTPDENEDNDEPFDENYDIDDISESFRDQSRVDLIDFLESAGDLLSDTDVNAGHYFWLTRCGHGAGFWDGDYVNGDRLTDLCKPYGNIDLYVGADGLVYG
jgi:hypothetical protein